MHAQRLLALWFAALAAAPAVALAQPAPRGQSVEVTVPVTAPVNINTAGVKELMTLDGVGQTVAERIVEYRDKHGPFKAPEEIRRVSGIGRGLWERNRDRIVVK